jgi:hypothetical protein
LYRFRWKNGDLNMFDRVVSLGVTCQVAHQIERRFGKQQTGFFDWIVSNHSAIKHVLEHNFADVLVGNVRIADQRAISVIDENTGLLFYTHDFPLQSDGKLANDWQDSVPSVRERYRRRSARLLDWLGSQQETLLIRRVFDDPSDQERIELESLIKRKFPLNRFTFLWVSDRIRPEWAHVLPVTDWRGADSSWDKLFNSQKLR